MRRRLWRYGVASLVEQLMLLPVWLVVGALLLPGEGHAWMLLLPALSLAGAAAGLRWTIVWKQLLLAIIIGTAVAYAIAGSGAGAGLSLSGGLRLATYFGMSAMTFLQGMTIGNRLSESRLYWFGLGIYFAAAVIYPRIEALEGTVPALTAGGLVCLAIALFATNGRFLQDATLASTRTAVVPLMLRKHNLVMMGSILSAVIVLTALFGNAFGSLLYHMIRWLLGFLPESEPPEEPAPLPPPEMPGLQGLPGPTEEPGLFALILEIVGYMLAALVIVGLAAAIVRWLYKHSGEIVRRWMKRWVAFLTRTSRKAEETEYTDEETVVFSWEAVGRRMKESWLGRMLARSRRERWEELRSNRERVRYLYRLWLREAVEDGYEPHRCMTPLETGADVFAWSERGAKKRRKRTGAANPHDRGADALIGLYYRVRYAERDATDEEVEQLKRKLDGMQRE